MRRISNFQLVARSLFLTSMLVTGTALFVAAAWTQDSTQERPVWDVQLARNAQAASNITIENRCQQTHTFTVTGQQTPFIQLMAAATFSVPGNSSYNLPVRFNTGGMNAGQYQGNVLVKCENCRKEKTCKQDREILPVRLTVLQDNAPQMTTEKQTPPQVPGPPIVAQEASRPEGHESPREGQTVSAATGSLEQEKGKDGKPTTEELRCYDFLIKNRGDKTITDIHFVFSGGKPVFPHAPDGWGGETSESGDLIFRTPPRSTTTGRTVERRTPKGVKPGEKLPGFRFYLTGKAKTDTIFFSYEDGTISPPLPIVEVVDGGGTTTEIESGDPKAQIRRTSTLICASMLVTAPKEQDVSDIHFTNAAEVTPPEGWHSTLLDEKSGTFVLEPDSATPPLGKGKTLKFKIYVKPQTPVKWKLTDAMHKDIPGASGEAYIK